MGRYHTFIGCLLFVVLWSSGWIGSKYGHDYAGTFTLLSYRYILVVLALLVFVSVTRSWRKLPPTQLLLHILVGVLSHAVFLGAGNTALLLGVSAGLVAFITALQPMITATLSTGMTGERANFRQWTGLALGLVAILLVISDKIALGGSAFSYSLPAIAVLAFSLATVLDRRISLQSDKAGFPRTPLALVTLIHCASSLAVMIPMAAFREGFNAQWGAELVMSILWLAIVVSLGAYGMMFLMLRKISAIKTASLAYLVPPTTMLLGYFVFGEVLTLVDMSGMALAGIAVWLVMSRRFWSAGGGTLDITNDPILRPPMFATQGLLLNANPMPEALNGKPGNGVPVDTESPDFSDVNDSRRQHSTTVNPTAGQIIHADNDSDRVLVLEQQLAEKNLEIESLNHLWIELKTSQQKIEKLSQALLSAEENYHALRKDQLEWVEISQRLEKLIQRQSQRPSRPPGDSESIHGHKQALQDIEHKLNIRDQVFSGPESQSQI